MTDTSPGTTTIRYPQQANGFQFHEGA